MTSNPIRKRPIAYPRNGRVSLSQLSVIVITFSAPSSAPAPPSTAPPHAYQRPHRRRVLRRIRAPRLRPCKLGKGRESKSCA